MKRRKEVAKLFLPILALLIIVAIVMLSSQRHAGTTEQNNINVKTSNDSTEVNNGSKDENNTISGSDPGVTNMSGSLQTVSYSITYDGESYEKTAYVYVPASYQNTEAMNVFYLMHGSGSNGKILADTMKPLFDRWISNGEMQPTLIVFPTYYPDSSYVVSDYSADYPLNHFFATEEIQQLIRTVEGRFRTHADSTDDAGLENSRLHRAFGGYSMGGVTTWDVLAYQAPYFGYYMPMAGDCWLNRVTDASSADDIADLLVQGLEDGGYSPEEFRIIAMVGGSDGTQYSMQPQIEALRKNHTDLITDENLIWWENEGGGHNQLSLELEVEHGLSYLWTLK